MLILDIALQIVGAFYMFAGVALVRAMATSRMIDSAIDAITLSKTPPSTAETLKERFTIVLAIMTFLSGLALISMSELAVHLFVATTLVQAIFLFWIAPRYVDPAEEGGLPPGRQQSINALVIFGAVTALVAWATGLGRLQPVAEASDVSLIMTGSLVVIFIGYLIWSYKRARLGSS